MNISENGFTRYLTDSNEQENDDSIARRRDQMMD